MKQEAQELVKQYIQETLKDTNGISAQAYFLLECMMKTDRDMASHLHDVMLECQEAYNRYFIPADNELN
jgi:hypothetical protein